MLFPAAANFIVTAALLGAQPASDGSVQPVPEPQVIEVQGLGSDVVQSPSDLAPAQIMPKVFEELSDAEIFDLVAGYIQGITTLTADFSQTDAYGDLTTGTLKMARPGRLVFDYDLPSPLKIVANQGLVYVHDADLETTDSYPVGKTPLKFLLSKKIKTKDAILEGVVRTQNSIALTLSSDDEETEGRLILVLEAPELSLRRWAVEGPRGDVTLVELSNMVRGTKISPNTFRVPEAGGTFPRDR